MVGQYNDGLLPEGVFRFNGFKRLHQQQDVLIDQNGSVAFGDDREEKGSAGDV
jgi:hypothetical protein